MFGNHARHVRKQNAKTKLPVDNRFIRPIYAVHHRHCERSFFLAAEEWTGAFLSLQIFFPRHALHEKGLLRQIGVGTLVSCQERALAVPLINRLSTAGQPLISFLHRFT